MSPDAEDPPSPDHQGPEDPFATLAMPASFGLLAADIERAYLARAASIHPDLAAADPLVQADAARRSATLNAARATLLDPERRAIALLARIAGAASSPDRSLPDGFLMEMMQTREQIDEELADDPSEARPRWRAWAGRRRTRHIDRVAELFDSIGGEPAPSALAAIRQELNAWRYIERLDEQLDPDSTQGSAPRNAPRDD